MVTYLVNVMILYGGDFMSNQVHFMSVNQSWGTPDSFMEYMKNEFWFVPDLDAAATEENKKAKYCYTEELDSLTQKWYGQVWLNPPYGKVLLPKFLDKCNEEIKSGRIGQMFVLIPARTDTKWFHEKVMRGASEIYLIKGRFNFVSPTLIEGANAPFPSMLVRYLHPNHPDRVHTGVSISTIEPSKYHRGWK